MKKLLLSLLLLASPLFADGRKYSYPDPQLNAELDSIYKNLLYLNAVNVRASTATITQLNVSTATFTGRVTVRNGTVSTDAAAFGQVPTVTAGQIVGTATNDNASAGNVGQYVESVVSNTNFPASGTIGDLTSISLTAGDWDISVFGDALKQGATLPAVLIGVSSTSGNSTTGLVSGSNRWEISNAVTINLEQMDGVIPPYRVSLSGTTTYYFKYQATYTVATPTLRGRLSARRVR